MRFRSKIVVVTGAAAGVGEAVVTMFAAEGATVIGVDMNAEAGEALVARQREAGHDVIFRRASVADESAVNAVWDFVSETYGRVDVLVNNAGISLGGLTDATSLEDWRKVSGVNLDGVFLMSRGAVRLMLSSQTAGAIVNVSSICSIIAFPGAGSYNASKHGVDGLTKTMALEYAKANIRVNSVCPASINTPMGRQDVADDPGIIDRHPLGRQADPEEIAAPILFLASDEASFITGAALVVDGGYTLQ